MTETSVDDSRAIVEAHLAADAVVRGLGMILVAAKRGRVTLSLPAADSMVNSQDLVHGGYLFLLADTAFAYCCASLGRASVTRTAEIAFLAPAHAGTSILATAVARSQVGRTSICDVRLESDGQLLAEFRGHGTLSP